MSNINKERHTINPFIDWLKDNKVEEESTLLYDHMEEYLGELLKRRKEADEINCDHEFKASVIKDNYHRFDCIKCDYWYAKQIKL